MTGSALSVPVTALVVLVYAPDIIPTGTLTSTVKVQLALAARLPPVRVNKLVPEICDPVPQTSFRGRPEATKVLNEASKSSVKVIPVMASLELILVKVNSRVLVPPGMDGLVK